MEKGIKIVLFENKDKKGNKHPDFTGKLKKDDKDINSVVLWKNVTKTGVVYYSGYINDLTTQQTK